MRSSQKRVVTDTFLVDFNRHLRVNFAFVKLAPALAIDFFLELRKPIIANVRLHLPMCLLFDIDTECTVISV